MPYTDSSGVQIPVGTDAFSPTAQFKTWQDKNATYNNYMVVALDSDRTALASPVRRDGLVVYVTGTKVTWIYEAGWRVLLEDTGWAAFTFNAALGSPWSNYGAPYEVAQYRRINGVVYVDGLIKSGTFASGSLIGTLPVGFRPAKQLVFPAVANFSAANLEVGATGGITIGSAAGNATLSLASIRFVAA